MKKLNLILLLLVGVLGGISNGFAAPDFSKVEGELSGVNSSKREVYDLKVAGVTVTSDNAADLSVIENVEGTVSYNHSTKTLTFDGATLQVGYKNCIHNTGIDSLKIKFLNTNNFSSSLASILCEKDTEIIGDGKISIQTSAAGIYLKKGITLKISGCTVETSGDYGGICGVYNNPGNLIIENSTVKASCQEDGAIYDLNTFTLINCKIASPENAYFDETEKGVAVDGTIVEDEQVVIVPVTPVNMDNYITLDVANNADIDLAVATNKPDVLVRLVSGQMDTTFVAPQTLLVSSFNVKADTLRIYGDYDKFQCNNNGENVTGIDLSNNNSLSELYIDGNNISSLELNENETLKLVSISNNNFTIQSLDYLYCSLPNRTDSTEAGILYPVDNETSAGIDSLLASNSQNATDKNWKLKYKDTESDVAATNGTYACPVFVEGIEISFSTIFIKKDSTIQLSATISPTDASNQNVVWTSEDENIATVSESGLVTGVAVGTTKVVVASVEGGFTDTCVVTVQADGEIIQNPENFTVTVDKYNAILSWGADSTFSDDFEDQTFDAWSELIEGDGSAGVGSDIEPYWTIAEAGGDGLVARCGWGYNINTWLITPEIIITNETNLTFSWSKSYTWSVSPNNNDDLFVKISTDNGATWTKIWQEEDYGEFANFGWFETTLDLSDYAGQVCKIAFNVVGNDAAVNLIDNVSIGSSKAVGSRVISDAPKIAVDARNADGYKYSFVEGLNQKEMTGYNVFLNGEQKATNIAENTYTFTDLDVGDYTAGVQRVYTSGVSEIVTKDFTIIEIIDVTDVSLSESDINITIDSTKQIVATVMPTNATNQNLTWSTSSAAIADVDQNGVVTGIATGTAIISVTTKDGGFSANCNVTVEEYVTPITGISISDETLELKVDSIFQLTATVEPESANQNVVWTIDDENIALLSQAGWVTAKAKGNTTITVATENGEFSATCILTVIDNIAVNELQNSELVIYPNPVKNVLNINVKSDNFVAEILDVYGKSILKIRNVQKIDISSLKSGVYYVKICDEQGRYVKKIVKI